MKKHDRQKQRKHHLSEGDEVMGQLLWLCRDSAWGQQDQGGLQSWEMFGRHPCLNNHYQEVIKYASAWKKIVLIVDIRGWI